MALSTKTILNTLEFAKRLNFNRLSAIGNSLEPALTAANIVMQIILGPPFEWWWNNQEVMLNVSNVAPTANVTAWSITANELTLTVNNSFVAGQVFDLSGFGTSTFFNGTAIALDTATPTQVTAFYSHANASSTEAGVMTGATTQDYPIPLPNFSFIEHAAVQDISGNKWVAVEVENTLTLATESARPRFVSAHTQDAAGNVTFRVHPAPDKPYPLSIHIQKNPIAVTSLNQTWAPIPDFMGYIYNWGFLSLMWQFADDPRAAMAGQKFVTHLLGASDGLSEQEKAIFLNNYHDLTAIQQQTTSQGIQARGAY